MDLTGIISEIYGDSVIYSFNSPDRNDYDAITIVSAPEGFVFPSEQGLRDLEPTAKSKRAVKILRQKRTVLLTDTDWWGISDQTMTEEQTAYRQELRDLPSVASPSLDENEQLTGVTWPTKPE